MRAGDEIYEFLVFAGWENTSENVPKHCFHSFWYSESPLIAYGKQITHTAAKTTYQFTPDFGNSVTTH